MRVRYQHFALRARHTRSPLSVGTECVIFGTKRVTRYIYGDDDDGDGVLKLANVLEILPAVAKTGTNASR